MRVGRIGTVRKGVAGLLVFALLALSVAPASAWPPPAVEHSGEHHTVAGHAPHDQEPPSGHHEHHPPALACCAALHCPMLLADLRPAPAEGLPRAGLLVRVTIAVRQPAGLDIAPALPPPRDAV